MLLDAHSLIYRAYFALLETPLSAPARASSSTRRSASGASSCAGSAICARTTSSAASTSGRSFRADRFSGYKATRRPTPDDLRDQFPIVRETLAAFRIPVYELEGYEADDLIGSLSLQAEAQGVDSHRSSPATWTCSSWSPTT